MNELLQGGIYGDSGIFNYLPYCLIVPPLKKPGKIFHDKFVLFVMENSQKVVKASKQMFSQICCI